MILTFNERRHKNNIFMITIITNALYENEFIIKTIKNKEK